MKALMQSRLLWVLLAVLTISFTNAANAQQTKKDKAAQKAAEIKNIVDTKSYVFVAQYASPMRGGQHYLTSEYDFNVAADSLIAYLPYFGQAFVAPTNPEDASMIFTATHFDYQTKPSKNGWDITIRPKDAKDVNTMYLSISTDGYATLRINSTNRDAIAYEGYIEARKKKA
jgi:hypothetical protein